MLKFNKLEQLIDKVYLNNRPYLTKFLDESEINYLKTHHYNKVNIEFDGGFTNSKRARALITPLDYELHDFKLTVFKVVYNKKFASLEHKHVLGTLMTLISRDMIGDIYIDENIYFSCTNEVKEFLLLNFKVINKSSIILEEYTKEVFIKEVFEEKEITANSLRVDLIVSEVYNLSRNKVDEYFQKELVFINNQVVLKSFKQVVEGDIITCRGKGKFVISSVIHRNKYRLKINLYR